MTMLSERPDIKVSRKVRVCFPEGVTFEDATSDLELPISVEDLVAGIPNHPAMCAASHKVKVYLGLRPDEPGPAFFKTYAWVPWPGPDGRITLVKRYAISAESRRQIARFDKDKEAMIREGRRLFLVLKVPSPSKTLAAQRAEASETTREREDGSCSAGKNQRQSAHQSHGRGAACALRR